MYRYWNNATNFPGEKIFVQYEKLVSNTEGELRRLCDFLKVRISEKALKCLLLSNKDGNFKRKEYSPPFGHLKMFMSKVKKLTSEVYKDLGILNS